MAISKSIEFFGPYVANTFNENARSLTGTNGMISGGEVTVLTGTTVSVAPYKFIQDGLIVTQDAVTTPVTVPSSGIVHLAVSSPDERDSSGVTFTVPETNEAITSTTVVIASRINGAWVQAPKLSLTEILDSAVSARADVAKGRLSDATVDAGSQYGTLSGVRQDQGFVTEGRGTRQLLKGDTTVGSHAVLDTETLDPDAVRNDHVVVRSPKGGFNVPGQLKRAQGETVELGSLKFSAPATTPSVSVDATASNTPGSSETDALGAYTVIWANTASNQLELNQLAHTQARGVGTPDSIAAGGTPGTPFVAPDPNISTGDRLYGCVAVGGDIAVFRTDAGAAGFTAGDVQILTSLTNTASNPKMVLSEDRQFAHVIFQYDESGAGRYQAYYMKVAIDDTNWGVSMVSVSPRIARGADGGNSDTDPQIAIDNDGLLHIAFVQATAPATVGDIVYLTITDAGIVQSSATAISTNVYAEGSGAIAITSNEKPRVFVTPQNEPYVVWKGLSTGVNEEVVFYTPELQGRIGFTAGHIGRLTTAAATTSTVFWQSAFSDDLGRLCYFCAHDDDVSNERFFFVKLNPVPYRDGVNISPDILTKLSSTTTTSLSDSTATGVANQQNDGGECRLDRDGSLMVTDLISGTTVTNRKFSSTHLIGPGSRDTGEEHPSDAYVATVEQPLGNANAPLQENRLNAFSRRIKSKGPITAVDQNGDYSGWHSIQQAANSLKNRGGKVIIRGGYHPIIYPIRLWSGIELIADGHVVLDFITSHSPSSSSIICQGPGSTEGGGVVATVDAAKHIFTLNTGSNVFGDGSRSGDAVFIYDATGGEQELSTLNGPYIISSFSDPANNQVVLNEDVSSLIGGMTTPHAAIYSTGVVLDGFTILDNRSGFPGDMIEGSYLYRGLLQNITVDASTAVGATDGVTLSGNYETKVVGCTFSGATRALDLDASTEVQDIRTTIRNCTFRQDVRIGENKFCDELLVTGSQAVGSASWVMGTDQLANATATPTWTNNSGTITATVFDNVSTWGEDGTVFANRLKLNQDAAMLTAGNQYGNQTPDIDNRELGQTAKRYRLWTRNIEMGGVLNAGGNIVPTSDNSNNVGQTSTRFLSMAAAEIYASPDASQYGFVLDPSNIANITTGAGLLDTSSLLRAEDPHTSNQVVKFEPYGRMARGHQFTDDFHYLYSQWVTAANVPTEYEIFSVGGNSVVVPRDVLNPGIKLSGGVIEVGDDAGSIGNVGRLRGSGDWLFDGSNDVIPRFAINLSLGNAPGDLNCTRRVGLESKLGTGATRGSFIGWELTSTGNWQAGYDVSPDGGGAPVFTADSSISKSAGVPINFYMAGSYSGGAYTLYFWATGATGVISHSVGVGDSAAMETGNTWRPMAEVYRDTAAGSDASMRLDFWEFWDTQIMSG